MRISKDALQELEGALQQYENEVRSSDRTNAITRTYLLHSRNFVRWLRGRFVP